MTGLLIRLLITVVIVLLAFNVNESSANTPAPDHSIAVMIELVDPPVAQVYAEMQASGEVRSAALASVTQAQLAEIEQAQHEILAALTTLDAQVLYRNQRVYNGIAVRVATDALANLRWLPGVKAIHPLIAKQPLNTRTVPLIGAPQLWQGMNGVGVTGEGVTIAIIDTGIDYLHTDFGGPGTGYAGNNPTVTGDVVGFPSVKIIGGYDFTGDDYNADPDDASFNPILAPDPDPIDCYPHGTSVAGTAAGYGVDATGATYTGPYNLDTAVASLKIGPGVAPLAQLYALKVFGCDGSSEVVDQAIEWAVDPNGDGDFADHVDVINLSLGSPYGSIYDTTALASNNAAAVGIIVVAAAGNSGDTTYVTGAPAIADNVISVAASASIAGSYAEGNEGLAGFSARGPRRFDTALKPDLSAPGLDIFTASQGTGNGGRTISGTSLAAPHVAGAMALLHQIHPDWTNAELKALVMNTAQTQIRSSALLTATTYAPMRIGGGRISLTQAVDAGAIAYNADNPGLVSIPFGAPEVLDKSSALKNIRIANKSGQAIDFTITYAPATDLPGVTFSLPVTQVSTPAGDFVDFPVLMHADAALMQHGRDTTLTAVQLGVPRHWLSEASGTVLLWPSSGAFSTTLQSVIATATPSSIQSTATFTYEPIAHVLSYTIDLQPITATVTAVTIARGVTPLSQPAYSLYVSDGSAANVPSIQGAISLSEQDEQMLINDYLYLNISTSEQPDGALRGSIRLPVPVLKLPVYAAPRPAAAMRSAVQVVDFGSSLQATQTLTLTGIDLNAGNPPTGVISLVSAVQLQATSPPFSVSDPELERYRFADLKYVGVTNDFAGMVEASTLYFAIVAHENWSTPNEVEFDVRIDVNRDGQDDYLLFNSNQVGYNNNRATSDVFITALKDLRTNNLTRQEVLNGLSPTVFDTALYNSSVMILPVRASALGLTAANSGFFFRVESYSDDRPPDVDGERILIDATPVMRFDLAQPGLRLHSIDRPAPTFYDLEGKTIAVNFDLATYVASGAQGVLLLHHHNLSEVRAEVVAVRYAWPHSLYFPVVRRQ